VIDLQPAQPLADAIVDAVAAIDAAAEAARLTHITPGAGQAMTYARKANEAEAALAAGDDANAADYPLVAARSEVQAVPLLVAAQQIADRAAAWAQIGAAIERARESGKAAAQAAGSHAEAGRAQAEALAALGELGA